MTLNSRLACFSLRDGESPEPPRTAFLKPTDLLNTTAWLLVVAAALSTTAGASADESLRGRACRSVHLQYTPAEREARQATAFYNETTVEQSAPGTYFCVCGFRMGYFGIQELHNGKKLVIFSVWDPGKQNNPNAVEEQQRVTLEYQGEEVRVKRFGNEGTGGQSFYDFDWQPDETYRFLVKAAPDGSNRTAYAAYVYLGKQAGWKHLATFSTLAENRLLEGYYSFVEDFRRNVESTKHTRRARFGNGWVKSAKTGQWQPLNEARFTADQNPVVNINAGAKDDQFYLATGGQIVNDDVKLWKPIQLKPKANAQPPADLP